MRRDRLMKLYLQPLSSADAVAVRGALFGEGEGPIFLDQFFCLGGEEHILDCLHTRASYDTCRHSEDAGVICKRASYSGHYVLGVEHVMVWGL